MSKCIELATLSGYWLHNLIRQYKNTDSIVGVFQTRIPQLMVTTPEYAHKIYVSDFRSFHDNEIAKFVSRLQIHTGLRSPFHKLIHTIDRQQNGSHFGE